MHLNVERLWTPILIDYGHITKHMIFEEAIMSQEMGFELCPFLNLIFLYVKQITQDNISYKRLDNQDQRTLDVRKYC
jgi:hypothetical protein